MRPVEATFRGLLEAAPDAILAVDSDGLVVFMNAQAERLLGYGRDELVGRPVELLVPEGVRRVHPSHRKRYVGDPRPRPMGAGMELAAQRRDGTRFPAEISLNAMESPDGPLVAVGIRDVTERLRALAEGERLRAEAERQRFESQLHQSQRLESLGQLAGGVAHDFNNILAVILIYTAMVAEEVTRATALPGGERWEPVRADIAQIHQAAERATALTHQLLAFGRREVVRPRVMSLNEVVAGVEEMLRRTIGEHVELEVALAPDLARILADPGQIEQVLVNVALNARDAMAGGGRLTIDTANVSVRAGDHMAPLQEPGDFARLRVSDTGAGMTAEVLERAFEPFYTTKPKGEGSGLGLATVYGIVTQAEGTVRIYSEPGIGTTFTAMFPTTEAIAVSPEPTAAAAAQSPGGETVLVVEDEEAMREVTRRILARNGYEVITARGGEDALATIRAHQGRIDLLLTDVVMPQMLGKEVAERSAALLPGLRVLYMSGYAHPVLTSQGTLAEGVTLLEKPFSAPVLLAKVREALDAG
ncbi:MAG TPA: ATP-binding protein [Candidatus Dormibacteraeota bacterium]|nr:ATP-binding protein [Candidatus Dormibacteraeota bacterium]